MGELANIPGSPTPSQSSVTLLAVGHYPPHPGGVSQSCAALFHSMARRGHRVHLLAGLAPRHADYDQQHRREWPRGFTLSRYPVPKYSVEHSQPDERRRILELYATLLRNYLPPLITGLRPDLLVACHESFCPEVARYAGEFNLPSVFMLRGSPTWQIAHGVAPPQVEQEALETFRRADLIIPVGRYMQECLENRGLTNLHHIPNFLLLDAFRPAPPDPALRRRHEIPDDAIVVLHVSAMHARKRPQDIIHSAAQTLRRNPKLFYVFLGGERFRGRCEELCQQLGLWKRFRFVPDVPYEEVPKYLNLADLVVLASEGEGVARVYLETQACGRTLLASDILAAREVIEDRKTGLLFRTADVDDLAGKTLQAAADPELRARIGRQAREAVRRFDLNRIVEEYIAQFRRLRAGRRWREDR